MRIGHISFRLAGSDGVSLECAKLTQVLAGMGHSSYYFAGELDAPNPNPGLIHAQVEGTLLVPEAHFTYPEAIWLTDHAFGSTNPHPEFDRRLDALSELLESRLITFIEQFKLDVLVAQNIFAIPMNLALSQAVYRVVEKTAIPIVAHHHDFYWERDYYRVNSVKDLLEKVFPPRLPNVRHMVINTMAQKKLADLGVRSTVLPNILDFELEPPGIDDYNRDLRSELGLREDDIFFLQPTRVIPRKGIELAIELIQKLADPRIKLVITHHTEYNTMDYLEEMMALAARANVPLFYLPARFKPERVAGKGVEKIYSLWDAYIHADFITYPSLYEGFGNALIETVFFRKPFLVNRYQVFQDDIEPTGIKAVKINGSISGIIVDEVKSLLDDRDRIARMTAENVQIAKTHFSFSMAETRLKTIFNSL